MVIGAEFFANILGGTIALTQEIKGVGGVKKFKEDAELAWLNVKKVVSPKKWNFKKTFSPKMRKKIKCDMVQNQKAVQDLRLPKKKVDGLIDHIDEACFIKENPGVSKQSAEYQKYVKDEYNKFVANNFNPNEAKKLNLQSERKSFEKAIVNADMAISRQKLWLHIRSAEENGSR